MTFKQRDEKNSRLTCKQTRNLLLGNLFGSNALRVQIFLLIAVAGENVKEVEALLASGAELIPRNFLLSIECEHF